MSKQFKLGEMVCPYLIETYTTYDTRTDKWDKTVQQFLPCIGNDCPAYNTYGIPDDKGLYPLESCLRAHQ
jgi:hypothetical protein